MDVNTSGKRHWFLTFWLVLMIVTNLFTAILYLAKAPMVHSYTPKLSLHLIYLYGIFSALNIIFAIALFKWQKWGFWGACTVAIIGCFLNVYFNLMGLIPALMIAIVSILILYGALNVGKEIKAWPRLK